MQVINEMKLVIDALSVNEAIAGLPLRPLFLSLTRQLRS